LKENFNRRTVNKLFSGAACCEQVLNPVHPHSLNYIKECSVFFFVELGLLPSHHIQPKEYIP
jgi:hypothetical protein